MFSANLDVIFWGPIAYYRPLTSRHYKQPTKQLGNLTVFINSTCKLCRDDASGETSSLPKCGILDTYISVTFVLWYKMFHKNCAPILCDPAYIREYKSGSK